MDKAGRVILPKPIRDRLGLRAGAGLEIEETTEGLTLKPVQERPSFVKEKLGLCVYTGQVPPGFDAVRAVAEDREDRIRKLGGL